MSSKHRLVTALVAFALMSTACGARLNERQLAAVRSAAPARSSGNSDVTPEAVVDDGVASTTTSPVNDASRAGTTGTTARTATRSAAVDPTKMPPGGNGGATDVGVSATSITIGNVSTLTGPVPGLFAGAVVGTQAFIAYQNSLGGLYGRKFKLDARDDQFDTGQNRSAVLDLLGKAFAFVGSFSLFDDAAVDQIKQSNIPDMTSTISLNRMRLPNNFALQPVIPGAPTGPFNYFKARNPGAITKVGTIYVNVPSAVAAYRGFKAAAQSVGYNFTYEREIGATETDFTSDVVRMRDSGVKMVYLLAVDDKSTARFAKAMASQNFHPEVFAAQAFAYDADVISLGGAAVDGLFVTMANSMYSGEDAANIPEVALMDKWIQNVKPGFVPDLYAADGWAQGRLLVEAMTAVGPKVTRAAVNEAARKVGPFDDHGLLPLSNPGKKESSTCFLLVRVVNGRYTRYDSPATGYKCDNSTYYRTG